MEKLTAFDIISLVIGGVGLLTGLFYYNESGRQALLHQKAIMDLEYNLELEAMQERDESSRKLDSLASDNYELKLKLSQVSNENTQQSIKMSNLSHGITDSSDEVKELRQQLKAEREAARSQNDYLNNQISELISENGARFEITDLSNKEMANNINENKTLYTNMAMQLIEFSKNECTDKQHSDLRDVLLNNLAFFNGSEIRLAFAPIASVPLAPPSKVLLN